MDKEKEIEYGADQIQILEGLEAVRKRPGMSIGSTSEKGLKRVMKLRVQAGRELGEIYHFDTFYNFLSSSIMKMIDIKVLITSGVVYKSIRDLPDSYNEKALQR